MTLNEWEQSNIEILTSREMGEWLGRRENRVLEQIRDEIDQKQYDFMMNRDYDEGIRFGLMLAYRILDKYTKGAGK